MELSPEDDPGAAWGPTTTRLEGTDPDQVLVFRIDEATAGTVGRFFNPGESLRLRWLDLPAGAGGPILLEIGPGNRSAAGGEVPDAEISMAA